MAWNIQRWAAEGFGKIPLQDANGSGRREQRESLQLPRDTGPTTSCSSLQQKDGVTARLEKPKIHQKAAGKGSEGHSRNAPIKDPTAVLKKV